MSIRAIIYNYLPTSLGSLIPAAQRRLRIPSQGTAFPNLFSQYANMTPKPNELPSAKQATEKAFETILQKIDILHHDPKTNECTNTGFFQRLEDIVKAQDPGAKVYLSGGSIRNLWGFLYEELLHAQKTKKMPPEESLSKIFLDEFKFRHERDGRICKMDALGVGSDIDILIEFSSSFENQNQTIDSVKRFINRLSKKTEHSVLLRTYFTVADAKEYKKQIERATRQGGSPVDWLAFPATPRSGSEFKMPPQYPRIVDDIIKGEIEFYPTDNAENPNVTTARVFRTLLEVPFLKLTSSSDARFRTSLDQLTKTDEKVARVFKRCMENIRLPEASNQYIAGQNLSSYEQTYANLVQTKKWFPEILPSKDIEHREDSHDPGDLRKKGYLVPAEEFIEKYTDKGILYHGTKNRESALPMLRGTLVVSTSQEDRSQGTAVFGRGFYTTPLLALAKTYGDCVLSLPVTQSKHLRILNLDLLEKDIYEKFKLEAQKENKDLHEFLCDAYDIDIIINAHVLIQNVKSFSILRRIDTAYNFFLQEALSTNQKELVIECLKKSTISDSDRGRVMDWAASNGHKEIIEMLKQSELQVV